MKRTIHTAADATLARHQRELQKVPIPYRTLQIEQLLISISSIETWYPNGHSIKFRGRVGGFSLLQDPSELHLDFKVSRNLENLTYLSD